MPKHFFHWFPIIVLLISLAACTAVVPAPTNTPVPQNTPLSTALLPPTLMPSPTVTIAPTPTLEASATPVPAPAGWKLAWQDEFDSPIGTKPDPRKWGYDLGGGGWGNSELEFYTNSAANAAMDGQGNLVITAAKIADPAAAKLFCWYGACKYTSARLLSKGLYEFTYGRIEGRMRIPFGQGIWPAFWMLSSDVCGLGWPACGEMDIMENIGREPAVVHGTVHGPGYSGANGIGKPYQIISGSFAGDFHVYAVEWEKDQIRWYVDDQLYFSLSPAQVKGKWVFDHPFFMILNVAVGGGWPGDPNASSTFPQKLTVDYIRVYQR
jgi:beta-glucanase (GH16 family)